MTRSLALLLALTASAVCAGAPPAGSVAARTGGRTIDPARPVIIGLESGKPLSDCLQAHLDARSSREFQPFAAAAPDDPDHIAAAWAVGLRSQQGEGGPILVNRSEDGGLSWGTPVAVGIGGCGGSAGTGPSADQHGNDQVIAVGPAGELLVGSLQYGTDDLGRSFQHLSVATAVSNDFGKSWSTRDAVPDIVPAGKTAPLNLDNVSVAIDPLEPRHLYVATAHYVTRESGLPPRTRAESRRAELRRGSPAFASSTDGGNTWRALKEIFQVHFGERTSAPQLLALPDRVEMYFYLESAARARLLRLSSTDRGETWSGPSLVTPYIRRHGITTSLAPLYVGRDALTTGEDIISVMADASGKNVLVAYADARAGRHETLGVYLTISSDSGKTWTAPQAVDESPNYHAFLPSVAIAPNGEVAVSFIRVGVRPVRSAVPASMQIARFAPGPAGTLARKSLQAFDTFGLAGVGGTGNYHSLVATRSAFVAIYGRTRCPAHAPTCENPHGLAVDVVATRIPY